jgi:hypothetical protein
VVKLRIDAKDRDEHFAVVISPEELAVNPKVSRLNVLYCSSIKPADTIGAHEVRLNGADGLERASVVSCAHFHGVSREKFFSVVGRVGVERRAQVKRKIVAAFRLV